MKENVKSRIEIGLFCASLGIRANVYTYTKGQKVDRG